MALDLQPWEEKEPLDLQPLEPLDLQPLETPRPEATISAARPQSWLKRAGHALRESLTPLIGPTREQVLNEGVPTYDSAGNLVDVRFRPMGGKVEEEGFFPAASHPMVPLPTAPELDELLAKSPYLGPLIYSAAGATPESYAKAAATYNTAKGFAEFAESPLGLVTGGAGAAARVLKRTLAGGKAPALLTRSTAGAYTADIARHVPEAAQQAGTASVTGTPQQRYEANLALAATVGLPGALGRETLRPARVLPEIPKPRPQTPKLPVSEFGGEEIILKEPLDLQPLEEKGVSDATQEGQQPSNVPVQPQSGVEGGQTPGASTGDRLQPTAPQPGSEAGATTAAPAELLEPATTTTLAERRLYPVVEVPLAELSLSKDVPNFKAEADVETGVVAGQQLEGRYERLGTGAITVWERTDGAKEVISGRHRFDLAKRTGESTIPAQIVREADGFTRDMAMTLDAEMNIRDGQGSTADYATYFRNTEITETEARSRGLLSRAKGQAGWSLGKAAGDDLYALYRAGKVTEPQAVAIAQAAPGEPALQRVGTRQAFKGAHPQELHNFIQAVRYKTKALPPEQLDLFGADDAAMNEAENLAKIATELQRELDKEIKATDNAARNAEAAKAKGIKFERSPDELLRENALLRVRRNEWDNWALQPQLVAQVLEKAGLKDVAPAGNLELQETATATRLDALEGFLQKAIDATDPLKGGTLYEGVTGAPVWLSKTLAHAALQAVLAAYRAGKQLKAAIEDGVAWLRGQGVPGFDEQTAREWLSGAVNVRQFGEKFHDDAGLSPEVRAGVTQYFYDRRPHAALKSTAAAFVQERGIENALAVYHDGRALLPDERVALGAELEKQLASAERRATAQGNTILAEELVQQQIAIADQAMTASTETAQALAAHHLYGRLSPSAAVGHAQRTFDEAAGQQWEKTKPTIDNLKREVLQQGNQEALQATIQDPAVNAAAKAAVNQAVIDSPQTRKAVILELTELWSQVPSVVDAARAQVRAKAEQLLNTQARPAGFTAPQFLRGILDDLATRAATIAGGHYQGAEPNVPLKDKFVQRLGLSEDAALRLARGMDKEFVKQMEAAKKKLSTRIATQRVRQDQGLGEDPAAAAVDRALRVQLRDLNLKLGDLVRRSAAEVDKAGHTIGQRVVEASGLKGEAAEKLQAVFDRRFRELVTERKRALLQQWEARGNRLPPKLRSAFEQLIQMTNLGAFDDAQFDQFVRQKLGLPTLTPELKAEIVRRANAIQVLPEESLQRQRAAIELMNFIERQKGLPVSQRLWAFYLTNILSGLTTHAINVISTGINAVYHLGLLTALNPRSLPQIVRALGRGVPKGGLEAGEILRSGILTGSRSLKIEAGRPLELLDPQLRALNPLRLWKYNFRLMAAEDLLLFKPIEEARAAVLARHVAKREGLSGPALQQRVADIMGGLESKIAAAKGQAQSEGLSGLTYQRRWRQIVEQQRPADLREDAREYALRVTFNNHPYGLLGAIAQGFNLARGRYPALNLVQPFVNTVANVFSEQLNNHPLSGLWRAVRGLRTGELYGRRLSADRQELHEQYAKTVLATAGLGALAAYFAGNEGDPDKPQLHGGGPRTKAQRDQLRQTGWLPYSMQFGRTYIPYEASPNAFGLAVLGDYLDAKRYRHLEDTDALNRVGVALRLHGRIATKQSFISGLYNLMESLSADDTKTAGDKMAKGLATTGTSFVVPNLLRQVDRLFDPTVYEPSGMMGTLAAQTPFVRREGRPAINVLGEPVEKYLGERFWSKRQPDDLWAAIAYQGAWIPTPDREQIVGDRRRGPDYYRVLPDDEYYEFIQESGQRIRDRLDPERISVLEPDQAKLYVQKIAAEEHERAKKLFR